MEWWQIGLAVLAIPMLWLVKLNLDYRRLSPEQKQGVERRLQRRKDIERYLEEVGGALRRTDALAQYPVEATGASSPRRDRAFRNRAAVWRLQETFEAMQIPQGFEKAHYALLQYLELTLKEWDDDPLELNDPETLRAESLAARERVVSDIEAALLEDNEQYAQDVWTSFSPGEPFPGR
jgi:hypothetical protein